MSTDVPIGDQQLPADMPARRRHTYQGRDLPLPFLNQDDNWLAFDPDRLEVAVDQRRCQVCGDHSDDWYGLQGFDYDAEYDEAVIGPAITGPPLCGRCVNLTLQICPHFADFDPDMPVVHRIGDIEAMYQVVSAVHFRMGMAEVGEYVVQSWTLPAWTARLAARADA